ncbi:hypothetical protein [Mucilaginibacter sp.]|uniref:hypothetical protein n=1 Tax=Mucilaginibacter sp. TaxID=1882438 RepID=UPI00283D94FF|nr:hypothetical protein [Mucilaginibacter sp.]MDR3693374.1 hypothetical protein [Mucilaginibacter sp.]
MKADFQTKLGHPDSALITAKLIIKKWPKEISNTISIGEYYEIKGDTISAAGYYKKALFVVNHILDSIGVNNRRYGSRQIEKAKALILLNRPEKAHAILKNLFDKTSSEESKKSIEELMEMSKHDILYGKKKTTSNGTTMTNW